MIDKGQIVLHENTDVLLDEYGLIKADEKQYELLDKQHILKVKKEQYLSYSCLTQMSVHMRELSSSCNRTWVCGQGYYHDDQGKYYERYVCKDMEIMRET